MAILKLEWTNYVQHYGLTREADALGRYEPVQSRHAWSHELFVTNLALLNLMRHGDHHANPQRPYQSLQHRSTSPVYPYDVTIMFLLALATPLFRRIVHPHLDRLESTVRQGREG